MMEYIEKLNLTKSTLSVENILDDIDYYNYPECFNTTKKYKKKLKTYEMLGKIDFMYFIKKQSGNILLALEKLPPVLWHEITSQTNLSDVIELYFSSGTNEPCIFRGFIGLKETTHITFESLEKFILLHPLIEKVVWGPLYEKPKQQVFLGLNSLEMAINITKLSEQYKDSNSREINFITKYSKSVMSFVEIDESFFVQIKYASNIKKSSEIKHINKLLNYSFDESLPYDIISLLSIFPNILTHDDLLKMDPPQVALSLIVASNIPKYLDETLVILNKLYDNKDSYPELISLDINDALLSLTINKEFDRIFTNVAEINNENICEISKKIEEQCIYNKKLGKENVVKYIEYLLRKMLT
jgi:hypothetical protein